MALFNAPGYRGPQSDHFDGTRFINRRGDGSHSHPTGVLRWLLTRKKGPWRNVDAEPGPPPPERVEGDTLRITLVGHATVLVQMAGLNFLTDPIWAERTSPVTFAGPKRFRPPGLRFEDLPPIDLVLVSHNHYDHLCVETLRRLSEKHRMPIVTGLGNVAFLEQQGIAGGVEIDWWDSTSIDGVKVQAVPMEHFSGRGPGDRDRTLWAGFVVRHPAGDVLFAGDTGYGDQFKEIRDRIGAPRVALLPIGAFEPVWFMSPVHVSPAEAVTAHRDLGAKTSVAIHYGTFALADDGMDEPVEKLVVARKEQGVSEDDFRVLEHGIGQDLP